MNLKLILFCLLICQPMLAQQIHILDQQVVGKEINVISPKGKVVATIPAGHRPQLNQKFSAMSAFFTTTFVTYDFDQGWLPIYAKDIGWYLLDSKGMRAKVLGTKYSQVFPASNGVHRAEMPKEGRRGNAWTVYLNKNGERIAEEQKFNSGTAYSEGLAIVQPEAEPDVWQIIDVTGKKVARLQGDLAKYIHRINAFQNGLALATLKRPRGYDRKTFVYQTFYYDQSGQMAIDVSKLTGNAVNPFCRDFKEGIAHTYANNASYFFDVNGALIRKMDEVSKVHGVTDSHLLIKDDDGKIKLLNRNFEAVLLPTLAGEELKIERITSDYIIARSKHLDASSLKIFDADKYDLICRTNQHVVDVMKDRLFIGESKGLVSKLLAIEDFKGKSIYALFPAHRLFTSIEAALPFKEQVQHLEAKGLLDANQLLQFPNLKNLSLSGLQAATLPSEMDQLSKLERLNVMDAQELQELPASLSRLSNLNNLQISDCPKLRGLEILLPQLLALESFSSFDFKFEEDFVKAFKAQHPEIQFSNWQSGGEDIHFEDIEVLDEKGTIPPPPPPPKKKGNE